MTLKHSEKIKLIQETLCMGQATANEVINRIYEDDVRTMGADALLNTRGWKFYNHLNKLFAPMEKNGIITFTGKTKIGESGLKEKVWKLNRGFYV